MPHDWTRRGILAGAAALAALPGEALAKTLKLTALPGSYGKVSPGVKQNLFWNHGTAPDFRRSWLETLRPYRVPGLQHLVGNVVDHELLAGAPYDAMAEFFFRDTASLQAAFGPRGNALTRRLDALGTRYLSMATREVVFRSFDGLTPPPGAIKRFGLVRRRPDLPRSDFLLDWRDVHGPEANATKGLIRYTINVSVPELSPDCPFDGYAELWWESREAYLAATALRARERAEQAAKGVVAPGIPALLAILQPERLF